MLKKPIWSAIETTLFYYSGDSTTGQVWTKPNKLKQFCLPNCTEQKQTHIKTRKKPKAWTLDLTNKVLHMCFERFLLAFESRDLSQADKSITRVSSFPSFKYWMIDYIYTQNNYLTLGNLAKNWRFGQFYHSKIC